MKKQNIKLTQAPYVATEHSYCAVAVDESGTEYQIEWVIKDNWDRDDEGSACEWDLYVVNCNNKFVGNRSNFNLDLNFKGN